MPLRNAGGPRNCLALACVLLTVPAPSLLVLILIAAGLSLGCQSPAATASHGNARGEPVEAEPTASLPPGTMTAELLVEGVSCASCDLGLRRNLRKLGGVLRIREGSSKQHLLVDFSPEQLASQRIVDAVYAAGYSAEVLVRATES